MLDMKIAGPLHCTIVGHGDLIISLKLFDLTKVANLGSEEADNTNQCQLNCCILIATKKLFV